MRLASQTRSDQRRVGISFGSWSPPARSAPASPGSSTRGPTGKRWRISWSSRRSESGSARG